MDDHEIRQALDCHWAASDENNFDVEHDIYREDAVLEYPQSGERIRVGATSRPPARLSRTPSASRCAASSARATSGSRNSSSSTTAGRLIR